MICHPTSSHRHPRNHIIWLGFSRKSQGLNLLNLKIHFLHLPFLSLRTWARPCINWSNWCSQQTDKKHWSHAQVWNYALERVRQLLSRNWNNGLEEVYLQRAHRQVPDVRACRVCLGLDIGTVHLRGGGDLGVQRTVVHGLELCAAGFTTSLGAGREHRHMQEKMWCSITSMYSQNIVTNIL